MPKQKSRVTKKKVIMIDTHAHIDFEQFDQDREEVIRRAFDSGIGKIVNIGADMAGSRNSVELVEKYDEIFAAVGVHPHEFNAGKILDIDALRELAQNKKIAAIGEIGLDNYTHGENPTTEEQKEKQRDGFIKQIILAKELKLPVVIHCRDAYEDCFEIIKKYPDQKFVFHCYGADLKFTKKLLANKNILFSFTGNITYAKAGAEIIEVIKTVPLEKIMLETDCPFLAPVPNRGKRNEPAYVVYVNEKIAEIKQISAKEVDRITTENAIKFFKLT